MDRGLKEEIDRGREGGDVDRYTKVQMTTNRWTDSLYKQSRRGEDQSKQEPLEMGWLASLRGMARLSLMVAAVVVMAVGVNAQLPVQVSGDQIGRQAGGLRIMAAFLLLIHTLPSFHLQIK